MTEQQIINKYVERIMVDYPQADKTLKKMISEVDDMGDISLMDTKLKNMIGNSEQKLIS